MSFADKIAPYAKKAAASLGMDPAVIMAQWLYETGNGSNTGTKYNNWAGIKLTKNSAAGAYQPADSIHAGYKTPDAFVADYVRVMKLSYYNNVRKVAAPGADPMAAKAAIDASPYATQNYNAEGWLRYFNQAKGILGGSTGTAAATQEKKTAFPCLCQICPDRPCYLLKNTGGK